MERKQEVVSGPYTAAKSEVVEVDLFCHLGILIFHHSLSLVNAK